MNSQFTPAKLVEIKPRRHCPNEIAAILNGVNERDGYLAGGFVRWLVSELKQPRPYTDVDLWCRTPEAFDDLLAYLTEQCGDAIYNNWIGAMFIHQGERLQLIRPRQEAGFCTYGEPGDLIARFDFTVTIAAQTVIDENERDFIGHPRLLEDDRNGRLQIVNVNCPVAVLQRIAKYARCGWRIGLAESMKIFAAWEEASEQTRSEWLGQLEKLQQAEKENRDIEVELQNIGGGIWKMTPHGAETLRDAVNSWLAGISDEISMNYLRSE